MVGRAYVTEKCVFTQKPKLVAQKNPLLVLRLRDLRPQASCMANAMNIHPT